MKIIDLLNLIAEGKPVPKEIKVQGSGNLVWEFNPDGFYLALEQVERDGRMEYEVSLLEEYVGIAYGKSALNLEVEILDNRSSKNE